MAGEWLSFRRRRSGWALCLVFLLSSRWRQAVIPQHHRHATSYVVVEAPGSGLRLRAGPGTGMLGVVDAASGPGWNRLRSRAPRERRWAAQCVGAVRTPTRHEGNVIQVMCASPEAESFRGFARDAKDGRVTPHLRNPRASCIGRPDRSRPDARSLSRER